MSNDWTINSQKFATWNIRNIFGNKGLGFYQIVFQIEVDTHPIPEDQTITVTALSGTVHVQRIGSSSIPIPLGRLTQHDAPHSIRTYSHVNNHHFCLEIEVDEKRIEAIESLRLGGDLSLSIRLFPTALQGDISHQLYCQSFQYTVSQSDWIKLLENIRFCKTLLLEIPVPTDQSSQTIAESTKFLANAQKQMLLGHFREAVGACRDALESLNLFLKNFEAPLSPDKRKRDKQERFSAIRNSLFELTHAAKHADEVTSQIEWNLADTRATIGLTATLLQWVSEEYGE